MYLQPLQELIINTSHPAITDTAHAQAARPLLHEYVCSWTWKRSAYLYVHRTMLFKSHQQSPHCYS